jgi:hypothetical protein
MNHSTSRLQLVNRPFVRALLVILAFILIASSLDMFWKKSSRRAGGVRFGENEGRPDKLPGRRDRLVTAHFMVRRAEGMP